MDEADAEDATNAAGDPLVATPGSSEVSKPDAGGKSSPPPWLRRKKRHATRQPLWGTHVHHTPNDDAAPVFEPEESTADADSATSTHAGKRLRDQTNDGGKTIDGNVCGEDPPSKSSGTRRPSFKPPPSVLDDPCSAAKPP